MALPIILQNLLSTVIASLDTFMLGFIGQTELAAVALANQLFFVLSLFFLGLTANTGIMMAQYLGKKDLDKVNQIFMLSCRISIAVCFCFSIIAIFFPETVMSLMTNEQILIDKGVQYLRYVGLSYLFMAFSQVYLVTLKTMLYVKKSVAIGIITLLINFSLNAVFIFGLFDMPKLGIIGVAIATCIARFIELAYCIFDCIRYKPVLFKRNLSIDGILRRDFFKIALPLITQGFVWGGAMTVMSAVIGHLGSDVVAANSIAAVIQHIATVISFGLAEAGAIFLGKDLGSGQFELAKMHGGALLKIAVFFGVLCCIIMFMFEQPLRQILFLTQQSMLYLNVMYKILAVNVIFASITYTALCGIFPAGGDTKYGLYIDGIVMWTLIAVGSIGAFIFNWNPIYVFIVFNIDELVKTPFVIKKYYKWHWIKNITR